ncbi:hypothetical protein CFB89_08320 [Burkholderia sp. AU16741]|nr:hypothetical protein CFB89_08320 [Burkholderia sp. AU16741]
MVFPTRPAARAHPVSGKSPVSRRPQRPAARILSPTRALPFLLGKGGLRHPQLSRAADLPTMYRTIGATRMAGACASPAMPVVAPRGRPVTPVANGESPQHRISIIRRHHEQPIPRPRRPRGRTRVRPPADRRRRR